jgi:hypothetical protein
MNPNSYLTGSCSAHVSVRRSAEGELAGRHIGFAALVTPQVAVMLPEDVAEEDVDGGGAYWVLGGPTEINESNVFTARILAATPVKVEVADTPLVILELEPSPVRTLAPSDSWLEIAVLAWASRAGLPQDSGAEYRKCHIPGRRCPGIFTKGCCRG